MTERTREPLTREPRVSEPRGRVYLLCTGSRDMEKYPMAMDAVVSDFDEVESVYGNIDTVIQGGARGADWLCKREGERRCKIGMTFPAEWKKYGKPAGRRRNEEMYEWLLFLEAYAPAMNIVCLAYPAPGSIGTLHMMSLVQRAGWPMLRKPLPKLEAEVIGTGR